jgi:hypothetical protein
MEACRESESGTGGIPMKPLRKCPDCCRIVLTGGPGGGKTTAADLFRREIGERVRCHPTAVKRSRGKKGQ